MPYKVFICSQHSIPDATCWQKLTRKACAFNSEQYFKNAQQSSEQPFWKPISSHCWCIPAAINPLSDSPELISNEK